MKSRLSILLFAACLLGAGDAVRGQTPSELGLRPIEPTVEDIDPLLRSMRRIEPGLRSASGTGRLYRQIAPGTEPNNVASRERIIHIAQGFVASYDQSQYGITRDGDIFAVIPPNTVFYLTVEDSVTPQRPSVAFDDRQIPGRVDGRVDGRVGPLPSDTAGRRGGTWDDYDVMAAAQRAVVLRRLQASDD